MTYDQFHFYWAIFEMINGIVASGFSTVAIYALIKHRRDNAPIRFWSLREGESKWEFSALIIASVIVIVLSAIFAYALYVSNDTLKIVAELMGSGDYLMVSIVTTMWALRFGRFA